jgi:hypothetical protein
MSVSSAAKDLPEIWIKPRTTARLHILRAHGSSKAVIIRRKPSKCVHIISWDTDSDALEYGSWFSGRIYSERCDLSWDGHWMVYLAMGSEATHGMESAHPHGCALLPTSPIWALGPGVDFFLMHGHFDQTTIGATTGH